MVSNMRVGESYIYTIGEERVSHISTQERRSESVSHISTRAIYRGRCLVT